MRDETLTNEQDSTPCGGTIVLPPAAGSVNPVNPENGQSSSSFMDEYRARAVASRDHCLVGGRDAQSHGEDILWLMGWADNAIEVQMIDEGRC